MCDVLYPASKFRGTKTVLLDEADTSATTVLHYMPPIMVPVAHLKAVTKNNRRASDWDWHLSIYQVNDNKSVSAAEDPSRGIGGLHRSMLFVHNLSTVVFFDPIGADGTTCHHSWTSYLSW